MLKYAHHSQNDYAWRNRKLGSTTIGRDGCYVTTICNGLANLGIKITPPQLVGLLETIGGLTPTGELDISAIPKLFRNVRILRDMKTTAHPANNQVEEQVPTALHHIENVVNCGQVAILHVDAIGHDNWPDHFVLATENWKIIDPWDGAEVKMSDRYGTPDKGIKRYIVLVGTEAINYPEGVDSTVGAAVCRLTEIMCGADPKSTAERALNHLL